MVPLFFILIVTVSSIFISCHVTPQITWLTYYLGGMIGIVVSGMILDFWNKKNRRYAKATGVRRYV
jgi:hypothetical protein